MLGQAEYGDQVRSLRKMRNLTQQELSEQSGISTSSIIAIENERQKISVPQLLALCEVFEIDPNTFLGRGESYHTMATRSGYDQGFRDARTQAVKALERLRPSRD